MSLQVLPPPSGATSDEAPTFSLLVIATDDVPADQVGRLVEDGILYVRSTATLHEQLWVLEQAIRSITDREFTASKPTMSAVTS